MPRSLQGGRIGTTVSACDELCTEHCLSAATWAALASRYDDRLLVEILMLAGHYAMLAGVLNSAGLRLERAVAGQLEAFQARVLGADIRAAPGGTGPAFRPEMMLQ